MGLKLARSVDPPRLNPELTTAYQAIDEYNHWLRIIIGAASAVVDGKTSLDEIYASERKVAGGDSLKNFM